MNPKYPIFIVSKNRWESRLTSKTLEYMKVPYFIIIEEQQYNNYSKVIDKEKILILDRKYQDNYETCDNLGYNKSKGPGGARNFAWDYSIKLGYDYHWVMDDNIRYFFRLNNNLKIPVADGTILKCIEDFTLRYKNVYMSGPNYDYFAKRKQKIPPFIINTRIYSCNFIKNNMPFRWRGRYNEDTILSLDILKAGFCTIQFNAFLQGKIPTQIMNGGNTEDFYKKEGTLPKSKMLKEVHPDVTKLVFKFKREHHHIDYRSFKNNKLIKKEGLIIPNRINNYGMVLKNIKNIKD